MCCSRAQPRSKRLRVEYGRLMRIIQALLGEHGAMYPLLDLIEKTSERPAWTNSKPRLACCDLRW